MVKLGLVFLVCVAQRVASCKEQEQQLPACTRCDKVFGFSLFQLTYFPMFFPPRRCVFHLFMPRQ